MPSQDPSDQSSDLPTICATYDHGGGVGLHNAFMVYTTNSFRPHLQSIAPQALKALTSFASMVASHIKIHYTLPPDAHLHSLPHEPTIQPSRLAQAFLEARDRPQTPSFFVNAYLSREICIAGRQDAVTTLLGVLRRLWCVLELCAADAEAVKALLAFAKVAESVDGEGYAGAVALLRYQRQCQVVEERNRRAVDGFRCFEVITGLERKEEGLELRAMCAALFRNSIDSFNGFYMRAIAVCAVEVAVEWGVMGRLLAWNGDAFESLMSRHVKAAVMRRMQMRSARMMDLATRRQLGSSQTLAALLDLQQDERLRESVEGRANATAQVSLDDQMQLSGRDVREVFFEVYRGVLGRLVFNLA